MKSFSYFCAVSIFVPLAVACSSETEPKPQKDVNASTPAGSGDGSSGGGTGTGAPDPKTFCDRTCIAADQPRCDDWAADHSDAFIAAFETCGDNPACITPLLESAPVNERQALFAKAYCTPCSDVTTPSCVDDFWKADGPGDTLRWASDARLDDIEAQCFPELAKNAGKLTASVMCGLSFSTCKLGVLQQEATVVCRTQK